MPGLFSRVGTYMAGAGRTGLAQMAANPALRRTAIGAAMGGAYGVVSDDTSILGGAMTGAVMGRYAGAGVAAARGAGRGMGFRASMGDYAKRFGMGVAARARLDARGARMSANQGYGKFRSMFR